MASHDETERMQALLYNSYAARQVRAMERPLLAAGKPLMRMAASAVAKTALQALSATPLAARDSGDIQVCLLAGGGDNGGDGLFAGAFLASQGLSVTAIATGRTLHAQGLEAFLEAGGRLFCLDPAARIPGVAAGFSAGEAGKRLEAAIGFARESHLLIDAMAGIGVDGALHGIPAALASSLGLDGEPPEVLALPSSQQRPTLPIVVAVDAPSGVGVDDGTLPGPYIPADYTVTFGAMKPCAMLPPAAYACGKLTLVDFGFDLEGASPAVEMVNGDFASEAIRPCQVEDSKYSRGVVGLVTGSDEYPGAAVLTSSAAARTNIGMVRYMGPRRAQDLVLQALPEAVIGKGRVEAWGVGSGVGVQERGEQPGLQQATIAALLRHYALSEAQDALEEDSSAHGRSPEQYGQQGAAADVAGDHDRQAMAMPPVVVDAGALELLPQHVAPQVLLTPHAGELARLLTRLGHAVNAAYVKANPLECAALAARETGATVLLKGAITIIAGQSGGSMRVLASGRAPACLATAGAGDVLTGVAAALLAQQATQVQDDPACVAEIAASAAYIHGRAAAVASGSRQRGWSRPKLYGLEEGQPLEVESVGHPILAADVADAIPFVFDELA